MVEDVDGVLITDGHNRLFLHPPKDQNNDYFEHQIDIVAGPFRGSVLAYACEGPWAFGSFRDQLATPYETLHGEAEFPWSYEKVRMKSDGLGHVMVDAMIIAGYNWDITLIFKFGIDQTRLPEVIRSVDRLFLQS